MPVADYATFKKRVESGQFDTYWQTISSGPAGLWMQTWRTAPSSGSAPATYRTCDSTTVGALWQADAAGRNSTLYLAETGLQCSLSTVSSFLLVDRLADQTGLVLNVASSQVTNLPLTPTRNTDGAGVQAAFVCWTSAANTTAVTGTMLYTNQAGTTGRVSQPITISTAYIQDRLTMIPLQDGDYGIRQVQAFTVSASVGVAGAFGIILFRPLAILTTLYNNALPDDKELYRNMLIGGGGNLAPLPSCGCLDLFSMNMGTAAATLYGRTNWFEA